MRGFLLKLLHDSAAACKRMHCDFRRYCTWARAEDTDPWKLICKCPWFACNEKYHPLCGYDGNTYNSMCHLQATECVDTHQYIGRRHYGPCAPQRKIALWCNNICCNRVYIVSLCQGVIMFFPLFFSFHVQRRLLPPRLTIFRPILSLCMRMTSSISWDQPPMTSLHVSRIIICQFLTNIILSLSSATPPGCIYKEKTYLLNSTTQIDPCTFV